MLDDATKNFILDNPQLSIQEMHDTFSGRYTKEQLRNYCKNNGISFRRVTGKEKSLAIKNGLAGSVRKQYHRTKINYDYFKTWSSNMAYIFGLWCADGNIYHSTENNIWRFEIRLKASDKYLLQDILLEMESEHKIYDRITDNSSSIGICCKTLYQDIVSLGGVERKSLTLMFPKVSKEYLPDFIRGYFDGDGCVHPSQKRGYLLGTQQFCEQLNQILLEQNIHTSSLRQKHPNSNCFILGIYKQLEFSKFIDYIYRNISGSSIGLRRKDVKKLLPIK